MDKKPVPYFDSQEKIERLKEEMESWIGTPHKHWCGVKGAGCDCIHFVIRIFESFGFGPFEVEWYPKDWHMHRNQELLEEGIRKTGKVMEVSSAQVRDGDILLYQFGRVNSHAGIFLNGHVYASIGNAQVSKVHFDEPVLRRRLRKVLRPIA